MLQNIPILRDIDFDGYYRKLNEMVNITNVGFPRTKESRTYLQDFLNYCSYSFMYCFILYSKALKWCLHYRCHYCNLHARIIL
jgi:hypothetical protein